MVQITFPPSIKERTFRNRYCISSGEQPNIIVNLDPDSLTILKFILEKHENGFTEVNSSEIYNYIKSEGLMKERRYHYKKEKLVNDYILIKVEGKSSYYIEHLVREFYKKIFAEQEKLNIINSKPNKYHFICSFLVRIPKNLLNEITISKLIQALTLNGYTLIGEGVSYLNKKKKREARIIDEISFDYERLISIYDLRVGLMYDKEDDSHYWYALSSDIHISTNQKLYSKIEKIYKKGTRKKIKNVNKEVAESICFTHTLDIFWYLYSIMNASLLEIHTYGPNEIKIEEVKNEKDQ